MSGSSWEQGRDEWTDGPMDGWTRRWGRGIGKRFFVFLNSFNSQLKCSNWLPQLQPFCNQSVSNLFVNWFEDWLTRWLGPQLPPFGGFWGRKSVSKPIWSYCEGKKQTFKMHLSVWIWIHIHCRWKQGSTPGGRGGRMTGTLHWRLSQVLPNKDCDIRTNIPDFRTPGLVWNCLTVGQVKFSPKLRTSS